MSQPGGAPWAQQLQHLADVRLAQRFVEAAGGTQETSARADTYGYHEGSQLMRSNVRGNQPAGIPVKSEDLRAYGQRTIRPGQVQPFGVVLLVRPESNAPDNATCVLTVLAASANAKNVLGIEAFSLVDSDLCDPVVSPFDSLTLEALKQTFASSDPSAQAPLVGTLSRIPEPAPKKAFLIVHSTEEGFVIDIEPIFSDVTSLLQGSLQTHSLAKAAVAHLQEVASSSIQEQCQTTVDEVRRLTGYDRVMIYKFHSDCHGEVVAESLSSRVPDVMLGLHFPATDIPQANRNIFMKMRSRMIAHVGSPSVKVLQSPRLEDNIILAGSQLRGVSGCHAQYLQNMGVHATLVLSIVTGPAMSGGYHTVEAPTGEEKPGRDGRPLPKSPLWGLLVCHHYSGPYMVNYDHRAAVEFLTKVFALQLGRSIDADAHAAQQKVMLAQSSICDVLKMLDDPAARSPSPGATIGKTLMKGSNGKVMCELANATGCAVLLEGAWHCAGRCPTEQQLDELMAWLRGSDEAGVRLPSGGRFGTICLYREGYGKAAVIKDSAAGVLAVDIYRGVAGGDSQPGSMGAVLWMRGEMIREQTWAGDKDNSKARAHGYEMSPRASFEAMKELIRMESAPWLDCEVEGAHSIQLLLQDTLRLCEEGMTTSRILVALNQERLRNMGELSRVANELRAVIRTAAVPIFKLDTNLRIVEHNEHAEPLFCSRAGGPEGELFLDYVHDASRKHAEEMLLRTIHSMTEPEPFQVSLLSKPKKRTSGDGTVKEVQGTQEVMVFVHIKRDVIGSVEELVIVCRDMTSQAALVKKFAARDQDYEELIYPSTSPMFCVDTSGCITIWNGAMERLTGVEKHAAIGKVAVGEIFGSSGMLRCIASEGSPDAMTEMSAMMVNVLGDQNGSSEHHSSGPNAGEQLQQNIEGGSNMQTTTMRFIRSSRGAQPGNSKEVEISMSCRSRIGSSGEVSGVFFFVQDLTLPKALEKAIAVQMAAEAAADAKTRHIAFLCHEIRNPVNGILATVQAMDEVMETAQESEDRSEVDVDELSELIRTMMACTDQLRRTVDGILDINKLEEGKLEPNIAPFKLNNVFRTVISQIGRAAEEKGLWLKSEVDPPELADMQFLGDEGRIQQILANFCWNSVKFTSEGGITMTVEAEEGATPDRRRLFWKVIDTGKGMSQETQASLFERYAMGKHKVGKYGGSGLGLSICRSLAELMKGHVHCVSALGKGSTFVLELELDVDKTKAKHRGRSGRSGSKALMEVQSEETNDASGPTVESAGEMGTQEGTDEEAYTKSSDDNRDPRGVGSHGCPPRRLLSISKQQQETIRPSQDPTSMTVLREVVQEKSVAVLVEVRRGEVVRQHWGGAAIGPEGMGQALVEANDDALRRAQLSMGGPSFAPALPHPAASAPVTADMNIGLRQPAEPAPATGKVPDETAGGRDKTTAQLLEDSASPAPADGPQRKVSAREKAAQRRAARSKGQSARPGQAPAPARPEGGMRTVLVVDDDPVNTKVLYRALSKAGLEVVIGEDGQDVIRLCINEGKRFDIVLLDENMRHMNGTTACIALRKYERDRGLPAMPVVATTGNTAAHDNLLYYGSGMNGILAKPMNMRTVVQDLDNFFRHWSKNGNTVDMIGVVARLDTSGSQQSDEYDRLSPHGGPESFEELLAFGELKIFGQLKDFALGDAFKAARQAAALKKE